MSTFLKRTQLLKKELLSWIYLTTVNTWWSFNFPGMEQLGTASCIVLSLTNMAGTTFALTHPERFSWLLNLDAFDDAPHPQAYKLAIRYFWALGSAMFSFYLWRIDYYHMSTRYYIAWYTHLLIFIVLSHRAAKRYKDALQSRSSYH